MRTEAAETLSDIIYAEAENDGIVTDVLALQVVVKEGSLVSQPDTSNALRYLLIDELELGLVRPRDRVVQLEITLPTRDES